MHGPAAVIDAAIAFGARRFLDRVHLDANWEFAGRFIEDDDRLLFLQFLHCILLYDRVLLDSSSMTSHVHELEPFFERVNAYLGKDWIETTDLGSAAVGATVGFVQSSVCRLVSEVRAAGIVADSVILKVPVPWAYREPNHHDYSSIAERCTRFGIPPELLPYVLFLWRGIVYFAFTNYHKLQRSEPLVYVAAPGRMAALRAVMNSNDVQQVEYPHEAVRELISDLAGVPKHGFEFGGISSLSPYETSALAAAVSSGEPDEGLAIAIRARREPEALRLRERWADKIIRRGECAGVGAEYRQSTENVVVGRDLTQIQIVYAVN